MGYDKIFHFVRTLPLKVTFNFFINFFFNLPQQWKKVTSFLIFFLSSNNFLQIINKKKEEFRIRREKLGENDESDFDGMIFMIIIDKYWQEIHRLEQNQLLRTKHFFFFFLNILQLIERRAIGNTNITKCQKKKKKKKDEKTD